MSSSLLVKQATGHTADAHAPPVSSVSSLVPPAGAPVPALGNTRPSWHGLLAVLLSALAVVAAVDAALHKVSPPVIRREIVEGIADLERSDPHTIVLGSSHARTFHVLGEHLRSRTGGAQELVAIPLELGKLSGYQWVLDHRIAPLVDERRRDGRPARPRLARFVLLTEWWDSCPLLRGQSRTNLPSRAWRARDFLRDAWSNGITDYNRNYLRSRFVRFFGPSVLVRDRGMGNIRGDLLASVRPPDPAVARAAYDARMREWRDMVEAGDGCIGDPAELAALAGILDWARARGLETTVVLFPRKPGTLTDRAKVTTLARFEGMVRTLAEPRGARVVDLSWRTPLTDADFMADFDHVSLEGNKKFAEWVLDHDLAYLTTPAAVRTAAAPARGRP